MSTIRKYADLLDLDPAPDIYQTPELTDDNSTHPTSTNLHSTSSGSDEDNDESNGIDRHRLDADDARTHFLSSNERDPAHPRRIVSKRKSYRSSSRKRRKDGPQLNGLINGLEISGDEEESLERKLARLRREVAEVKEEYDRKEKAKGKTAENPNNEGESLDTLRKVLDSVDLPSAADRSGAAVRLAQQIASVSNSNTPIKKVAKEGTRQDRDSSSYTVSYAPGYQNDHTLSKVSEFDSRLALIETTLGIDAIPLPSQDRSAARAVLPSLDTLDKQLSTLSTSTESSLDVVIRRVRQLTQNAEKLEQAKKAARAAYEALQQEVVSPSSNDSQLGDAKTIPKFSEIEDPEAIAQINALYGTLPTIESLAPLLPSVLDRLRSLRSLHADAATARQTLTKVELRQEEMQQELQGWREGLTKVETAMQDGEQTMKGNTEMVEGWVKELEERMQKLGQFRE